MKRIDLKANGDSLQTIITMDGGHVTEYYIVQCDGFLVGVGIFHNHNDTCTCALVKDEVGEKHMLGRVSDEFPLEVSELHQLEEYYHKIFPDK